MLITEHRHHPFKIASSGFMISLLGALPLGTLNLTAFEIAATDSPFSAFLFAIGVVFIELLVVGLMLVTANRITVKQSVIKYIIPIGVCFLIYLAFSNFYQFGGSGSLSANAKMFQGIQSPLVLGLLLSALNPLQFPYWFGWNSVMVQRKKLDGTPQTQIPYILGIGTGTLGALLCFIFLGSYISEHITIYEGILSLVLGLVYLAFSIYLIFVFFKKYLTTTT